MEKSEAQRKIEAAIQEAVLGVIIDQDDHIETKTRGFELS